MVLCVECGIVIGGRDAARCWRKEWREAAMEGEAAGFVAGVRKCFEGLRDPRVQASCDHLLFDIVSIAVLAVACDEKSNEITAIPEVLKLLSLKGCTVTIDAMGCQTEIVQQIRTQKGHYVLALKGNQSGLEADMQQLFDQAIATDFADVKHGVVTSTETGHGRLDERTCHVMEVPTDHPRRADWPDLRSLAVIVSRREIAGEEHWESRLDISSLPPKAKPLANAIRKHWSIENSQHWVLDIAFDEDARRQPDRHGGANLATIRRLTLSLLRQDTSLKRGIKAKRFACALDPNYLLQIFQHPPIDA